MLADRTSLAAWLSGAGLADHDVPVSDADAVAARELREALVTLFRFHAGCLDAPVPDAEAYLQHTAERYPIALKLSAGGCMLVPAQAGIPGAFGALLAAAADAASRGAWARLKICKNTSCHAGFFDKTRNLSGLYCSTACNSQMSMRAYRTRLKNEGITELL
jgi:predicted RNA-binding Zn ribbon-like protein